MHSQADWAEVYTAAYRYGVEAAVRHHDKSWDEIEAELREGWETPGQHLHAAWAEVKDAVHDAWARVHHHASP